MGLLYAVLFACVATACAWQTQMTMKALENNPLLNSRSLGNLQNAWKSLEKASNDSYVLMFRSKNHEPHLTCVTVNASIYNETAKTANYTRTYYNTTSKAYSTETFLVRALNQSGYSVENVIRAGLNGTMPSATPVPMGSNAYVEYADYSCNSSSTPFVNGVMAVASLTEAGVSTQREGLTYLDFYVVFNQGRCNVLRAPLLRGGCDLWLKKSELPEVLKPAPKKGRGKKQETEDEDGDEEESGEGDAVFKRLPNTCRFAFLAACGYPQDFMYNETICNRSQTATTEISS